MHRADPAAVERQLVQERQPVVVRPACKIHRADVDGALRDAVDIKRAVAGRVHREHHVLERGGRGVGGRGDDVVGAVEIGHAAAHARVVGAGVLPSEPPDSSASVISSEKFRLVVFPDSVISRCGGFGSCCRPAAFSTHASTVNCWAATMRV